MRHLRLSLALFVLLALPAVAQLPEGPEILFPGALGSTLAAAADGSVALVWTERMGEDEIVMGRVFQADGTPLTGVFRLSSSEEHREGAPGVARMPDGGLVATWYGCESFEPFGVCNPNEGGFFIRRFAADGTPLGAEERLNVGQTIGSFNSRVAVAKDGSFLAAWSEIDEIGSFQVLVRRYAADGTLLTGAILVNTVQRDDQFVEQVVARPDGSWIVVWTSLMGEGDLQDIAARLLAPDGTPQGAELQLNPTRDVPDSQEQGPQDSGRVGVAEDGSFVAVWNHSPRDPYGRLFDANGAPKGAHFAISSGGGTFENPCPEVAVTAGGSFLVVWQESLATEESPERFDTEVWGRWFAADGTPEAARFRINARTDGIQVDPEIFPLPDGDLMVVWRRRDPEGQPDEVLGRRLAADCTAGPTTLCLQDGRFRVEVAWKAPQGTQGMGSRVPQTQDTGAFWFFQPTNLELMVKVLDGRGINGHFWVFFGALSNVEYTLMVTDTEAGRQKLYINPQGTLASVGDTAAFPE